MCVWEDSKKTTSTWGLTWDYSFVTTNWLQLASTRNWFIEFCYWYLRHFETSRPQKSAETPSHLIAPAAGWRLELASGPGGADGWRGGHDDWLQHWPDRPSTHQGRDSCLDYLDVDMSDDEFLCIDLDWWKIETLSSMMLALSFTSLYKYKHVLDWIVCSSQTCRGERCRATLRGWGWQKSMPLMRGKAAAFFLHFWGWYFTWSMHEDK